MNVQKGEACYQLLINGDAICYYLIVDSRKNDFISKTTLEANEKFGNIEIYTTNFPEVKFDELFQSSKILPESSFFHQMSVFFQDRPYFRPYLRYHFSVANAPLS